MNTYKYNVAAISSIGLTVTFSENHIQYDIFSHLLFHLTHDEVSNSINCYHNDKITNRKNI